MVRPQHVVAVRAAMSTARHHVVAAPPSQFATIARSAMTLHLSPIPTRSTAGIPDTELGFPGAFPFTRGIQPTMYRGRLWTMRQYAGFGTAAESNRRYRYLLAQGVTGLSVAFDLPTQMGYDSDHPLAAGEVGRVGVAIDSLEDMARAVRRHPARPRLDLDDDQLDGDHPARALRRGGAAAGRRPTAALSGTVQNDILKEYVARGTYIYPPRPSLRIVTDIFAFCERDAAQLEHDLDQRLSHPRGRRRPRCRRSRSRSPTPSPTSRRRGRPGSTSTAFGQRLSFFFNAHNDFLRGGREVPGGAAAVGADHARPLRRDQPARPAAALPHPDRRQHAHRAAARQQHRARRASRRWRRCSAARSRCTATGATRRWRCRPRSRRASRCGRSRSSRARSGVANTVDPVAGLPTSIEELTNRIEQEARALLARIDAAGGTLAAIEQGLIQREIQESAYRAQLAIDSRRQRSSSASTSSGDGATRSDRGAAHRSRSIEPRQIARVRGGARRPGCAGLAAGARRGRGGGARGRQPGAA